MLSRYVVLEELGRGGMGCVVRAYDPRLQREVALKEVRREHLSTDAAQRMLAEARAMAKLSHANVVAVYDVEELHDERVVLVMEYVPGQTLRRWLGQEVRSPHDIVARFVAAGRGLIAAHEVGLLHRDFKPDNVLISTDGAVKVTDFGLAKVDGTPSLADSGSSDALTQPGDVMGTPRYMAPEQHRGQELTAAADQYAFCVALWEALSGELPFSGNALHEEKDAGPPRWPTPGTPRRVVQAVIRGLAPRPRGRWPSMEALLEALASDPARRRNRWLLGVGGLATMVVGVEAYFASMDNQAKRCSGAAAQLAEIWDDTRRAEARAAFERVGKSYARDVWARTEQVLDDYAANWVLLHTDTCEATTTRGEQAPAMMDLRMACLHRSRVSLRAAVDTLADADAEVVQKAHDVVAALPAPSRCADVGVLAAKVEPPPPESAGAVEAARAELARARSLMKAGRFDEATRVVEAVRRASAAVEYGPLRTDVALADGRALNYQGQYDEAQRQLRHALQNAARWRQRDAMGEAARQLIYVVGRQQRRMAVALRYRPLAAGLSRGDPSAEATVLTYVGSVLSAQGKYAEAEAEHRAALALTVDAEQPDYLRVARLRNNIANSLERQGRFAEAVSEFRASLALSSQQLGPNHPRVASTRNNLGVALHSAGKYLEAETEARDALAVRIEALGPGHVSVAQSRNNLGMALHDQGRLVEAEAEYRAALAIRSKVLGPEHLHVARSRNNVAVILSSQGKNAEAEAEYRAVLALLEKLLGPDHPNLGHVHHNLGIVLDDVGDHVGAEAAFRDAVAVRLTALGPDHPEVARSRTGLANSLIDLGRPDDALPLARLAWERRQRDDIPIEFKGESAFALARALWAIESPDHERAREFAEEALRAFRTANERWVGNASDVERWLETHR